MSEKVILDYSRKSQHQLRSHTSSTYAGRNFNLGVMPLVVDRACQLKILKEKG